MVAEPGTDMDLNFVSTKIGNMKILKSETIQYGDEKLNAKCTDYDKQTGIMTFMFDKPKHEMELPEIFIDNANGIIKGESNCELILY